MKEVLDILAKLISSTAEGRRDTQDRWDELSLKTLSIRERKPLR